MSILPFPGAFSPASLKFAGKDKKSPPTSGARKEDTLSPRRIKEELDQYVMGQEVAKRRIATALHEHYKRVMDARKRNGQSAAEEVRKKPKHQRLQESPIVTPAIVSAVLNKCLPPGPKQEAAYETLINDLADTLSGYPVPLPEELKEYLETTVLQEKLDAGVIRCHEDRYSQRVSQFIKEVSWRAERLHQSRIEQEEAAQNTPEETEPDAIDPDLVLEKNNLLMVGPSGSGKTHIIRNAIKVLEEIGLPIPFVRYNGANLTEAGYIGGNVEDIAKALYMAAGRDIERAQTGIVYIDEIDKKKMTERENGRDVSGEGAQDALLTLLEDGQVEFSENQATRTMDMSNVLFILGGAFTSLPEKIARRLGLDDKKKTLGFGTGNQDEKTEVSPGQLYEYAEPEDIINCGMKVELVGRAPVIVPLNELDEEALASILTQPKDALLKKYIKNARLDGVNLEFTPEAIREIARIAQRMGTGARALKTVVERVTEQVRFEAAELPKNSTVTVDVEDVHQANRQLTAADIRKAKGKKLDTKA